MTAVNMKYNPEEDTQLTTFFLHRDAEGNFLDIDTQLFHSEEHGFYLQEKKVQVWNGRCWENAHAEHVLTAPRKKAHRRVLICPCSPLTPAHVIRLIVENDIPEEGGARSLALKALQSAGVF